MGSLPLERVGPARAKVDHSVLHPERRYSDLRRGQIRRAVWTCLSAGCSYGTGSERDKGGWLLPHCDWAINSRGYRICGQPQCDQDNGPAPVSNPCLTHCVFYRSAFCMQLVDSKQDSNSGPAHSRPSSDMSRFRSDAGEAEETACAPTLYLGTSCNPV